jgi:hypothetical protein
MLLVYARFDVSQADSLTGVIHSCACPQEYSATERKVRPKSQEGCRSSGDLGQLVEMGRLELVSYGEHRSLTTLRGPQLVSHS